jgi:VWFA-related protein
MGRRCFMSVHRIGFIIFWTLSAATLCAITNAQPPSGSSAQNPHLTPRSREEREQKFRAEHHAIINVKVTDPSGKPIIGLTQNDFTVIDNSQPRTLGPFAFVVHGTRIASPRVVLLLDVLNQSTREFAEDVVGIRKFLALKSGELSAPTAIALLSSSGLNLGEASQDRNVLMQQLDAMTNGVKATRCQDLTDTPVLTSGIWTDRSSIQHNPDQAPNCLNDKFIISVTDLERLALKEEDTPGRLILIWIGPGWPRLDGKQFVPDTPQLKENFFEHLVLLTREMREGQVTLNSVSALDRRHAPTERTALPDEVARADDMSSKSLSLPAIVRRSGGQLQDDSQGIPDAIAKCMQDAEFFYVLSFDFQASPAPHEFHSIEVQVNRPGATVRTNTVYYSEP